MVIIIKNNISVNNKMANSGNIVNARYIWSFIDEPKPHFQSWYNSIKGMASEANIGVDTFLDLFLQGSFGHYPTEAEQNIYKSNMLIPKVPDSSIRDKVMEYVGNGIKKNSVNNKMANKWITYVKDYASKNGISYRDALRDPKCKAGYKKGGSMKIGSGGRASSSVQPVGGEVVSKADLIDDLIGLIGTNVEGLFIDDLYKLIQRPTLSLDDRDNRFPDLRRLLQKYVAKTLTNKPSIRRELNTLSEDAIDYLHNYYNLINAFNAMLLPVATSYTDIPSSVGIPVANAIPAPNPNYINIV